MSLQITSPPSSEPVTLAEAKTHLKLDTSDEDALIASLIAAARARAEWHTGRAFVTQSWTLRLDGWPRGGIAEVPLPPLQNVGEIAIHTPDGLRVVLDPATYRVGTDRVMLGEDPPVLRRHDAVEIVFTAGYGDPAAVPDLVKQAILRMVADLHTHRGEEGVICAESEALLAPYRVFKL